MLLYTYIFSPVQVTSCGSTIQKSHADTGESFITHQTRMKQKSQSLIAMTLNHGMVVSARKTGLSISDNADLLGFSDTTISGV